MITACGFIAARFVARVYVHGTLTVREKKKGFNEGPPVRVACVCGTATMNEARGTAASNRVSRVPDEHESTPYYRRCATTARPPASAPSYIIVTTNRLRSTLFSRPDEKFE